MNIKRLLPQSNSTGIERHFSTHRNLPLSLTKSHSKTSKVEKISEKFPSFFAEGGEPGPVLTDEIPAETVNYVVQEAGVILSAEQVTSDHWRALSEFFAKELEEFVETRQWMNDAEQECRELLVRAEQVCDPAQGEISQNQVLMVSLSLQEARMRRDHLRARVKLVIDELTREILAGLSSPSDPDSLEIRLRGTLGNLA